MAQQHPAFFGEDTPEQKNESGGIPADLLPYLEIADEGDELALTDVSGDKDANIAEAERASALRALLEASLLAGPVPSILSEIENEDAIDEEFAEDVAAERAERQAHESALDEAAYGLALSSEMEEVAQSILARAPEHSVQPSLERVAAVLDFLADPHTTYPSIHITGTNGKTSTARLIDALLGACGMTTGRFTSPHLIDLRERISIAGEAITPEGFLAAYADVAPYIELVDQRCRDEGGPRLSFFECLTVMAFAAFADHPVDAAVVEVGMGGRWDATNTVDAGVSVITPIDFDHTKWLGSSIRQIATEKAGIIKAGQIVVVAEQPEEALEVILERARQVDAIVRLEGRDFEVLHRQMGVGGQMVTVKTPSAIYEDIFVPLFGQHQAHNAALALVAVEAFMGGRKLDGRIVENGMLSASSPGRLQVVRTSPTILVDAAHNQAGARVLAEALNDSFPFQKVVGVYSAMADKDSEAVLGEMEPHLESIVLTALDCERGADIHTLHKIAEDVFGPERVEVREDLAEALDRAAEWAEASVDTADQAGVIVFGSVVLAGDMLRLARIRP